MPSMFGGDSLSEDYAPWYHEERKKREADEAARKSGEIPTVEVTVTWTSVHRIDVPTGMIPHMFADQINESIPQEVADQLTSATADMTSWAAST